MHDLIQRLCSLPFDRLGHWLFLIPAFVMLLAAAAAVMLRNLIHCALCLTLSFIALGVLFIALGAEFVGFVQLLVYVGAVAMLIIFAILLTPAAQIAAVKNPFRTVSAIGGGLVSFLVLGGLLASIFFSPRAHATICPARDVTAPVAAIGDQLMWNYMLPLQATGLLLTAALIGAALLAKEEKQS